MKQALNRVWDLLHYLSGNGSWTLNGAERLVVNAAIRTFSEDLQALVDAQLRQSYFVERMSRGRINVLRFYAPDGGLRILDPAFADLLVVVRLAVDGKERDAHVVFLRGYIFSIEFREKAASYVGRQLEVLGAKLGEPKQTYTRAMDRHEHDTER